MSNLPNFHLRVMLGLLLVTWSFAHNCSENFTITPSLPKRSISTPLFNTTTAVQCQYVISGAPSQHVQLEVLNLESPNPTCFNAPMRVFDGLNPNTSTDNPAATFCSDRVDRPVFLSKSSTVTLLYTKLPNNTHLKFEIIFRIVTGYNMLFDSSDGLFQSPNFMNKLLPQSTPYSYRIEAKNGSRIHLFFSYIEFGSNVGCRYANFSIFDGPDTTGLAASNRCNRSVTPFISKSNIVIVKFINWRLAHPDFHGFRIYYTVDDCHRLYTAGQGELLLPLHPFRFPLNTHCTYQIETMDGKRIYIKPMPWLTAIKKLIKVSEYDSESQKMLETFGGNTHFAYYSTSKNVTVEFKSEESRSFAKFSLQYRTTIGCNLTLGVDETLTSPRYPHNYTHDSLCYYYFHRSVPDTAAYIYFSNIEIEESQECLNDSLTIYDGAGSNAAKIDKICRSTNYKFYLSFTGDLFIIFKTNEKVSAKGFKALLLAYAVNRNGTYRGHGLINSFNYPSPYPIKVTFTYWIQAVYGNTISLKFRIFDIEQSKACSKDSLRIFETRISNETLLETRCGNDTRPFISTNRTVVLLFTSDATIVKPGFLIYYSTCGGHYTFFEQTFQSPSYNGRYPNNSHCRYEIDAYPGFHIRLIFYSFSLENSKFCKNDKISIYENTVSNSSLVHTRCGNDTKDFFSKAPKLVVVFQTNSMISDTGFIIRTQVCSRLLTSDAGTILSPDYPAHYPKVAKCTYTIKMPKGAKVQLRFRNFTLETSSKDYLQIRDVATSSSRTYIGSDARDYLATGNEVLISFVSYYQSVDRSWAGFRILFYDNQGSCSKYKPCHNNATCVDIAEQNYTCNCPSNFTGKNCSVKIVPCKSSPCLNNATCTDIYGSGVPSFHCQCREEYYGTRCEKRNDPCQMYVADRKWQRSVNFTQPIGGEETCDWQLKGTWYRFMSKAGGEIPSWCPEVNACGTSSPIWANGTLPNSNEEYANLHACVRSGNECCALTWPLRVKRCPGDGTHFFVYQLRNATQCPMAYCSGTEVPCKGEMSSTTGFSPCTEKVPRIDDVTVSTTKAIDKVVLRCRITTNETNSDATFEITWLRANVSSSIKRQTVTFPQLAADLESHLLGDITFRLGQSVYCRVRSSYAKKPLAKSEYHTSNLFYAGLKAATSPGQQLNVKEGGNQLNITLSSTVPVVCPGSGECTVRLFIRQDSEDVLLKACSVVFDSKHVTHMIEVFAKQNFIANGNRSVSLRIAIDKDTNAPEWKDHVQLPPIRIDVIDVPTARCWSNGDPRILTFDKQFFAHFQPGDHVLVKSLAREFEVHVRTWQCGAATCNCGIAAKENNDVIIVDMCFDGIPRIKFGSKQELAVGTSVKRDPTGKSFVMKFPSGSYVRFDAFGAHANVIVQVPSDDFGSTRGLCGTFDGNLGNDLLGKDGKLSRIERGSVAPESFTESWKIPAGQSLFYYKGKADGCPKKPETYCNCQSTSNLKSFCIKQSLFQKQVEFATSYAGWKEISHSKAEKCSSKQRRAVSNAAVEYEFPEYIYAPQPLPNVTASWPTKSGKTEQVVTSFCETAIKDSLPGKVCAKVEEFNFTTFIAQCVEDIKITDDNEFSVAAVRAMQDACEEILLRNTTYWERDTMTNGTLVPSIEMANTLCPGLCSGHGRCLNGSCACDSGFTSADCSIDSTKGPDLTSIQGTRLCDARNRSDCYVVRMTGKDFMDSNRLSCLSTEITATNQQSQSGMPSPAFFLSFREIVCDFSKQALKTSAGYPAGSTGGMPFVVYNLQASNDKIIFSAKKHSYLVYDSKCMDCNATTMNCSLKSDTCNANGYCLLKGEAHPIDKDFVCDPSDEKVLPGKSTDSDKTTVIAVTTVVSILVVVFLVAVLVKLKGRRIKRACCPQGEGNKPTVFQSQVYELDNK